MSLPWLEVRLVGVVLEVHQRREEQDHIAALVHDRAVAEAASNLAR